MALLGSRDNEDLQTFDVGGCVASLLAYRPQSFAATMSGRRLLEGDGEVSRVARFVDDADFEAKKQALRAVILAWIRDRD